MKVLFVFSIGKLDGGAAAVWMNLLDGLTGRGVEPYVVIPQDSDGTLTSELERRGIPWRETFFTWWVTTDPHPHSLKRRIVRAGARQINARAEREIGRFIDDCRIELVYICDGTISAGLDAAKKRSIPVVWHFHQFIREDVGISYIDLDRQVESTLARADRIVAVSRAIASDMERRFPLVRVMSIPNGIAKARIVNKREILAGDEAVFTLVGRIDENKRQEDAIRAFAQIAPEFPQARLMLVGTGQDGLVSRLEELASQLAAAKRIEFCGYQSDIKSVWKTTDIALNCSYSEGCSMVVAEAMSCGCLVLCSDAEGNAELIGEGTGLLYERCNVDALAEQMRWLLEHPDAARAIAQSGRESAARLFDIDVQVDAVYGVFTEVLS